MIQLRCGLIALSDDDGDDDGDGGRNSNIILAAIPKCYQHA